MLIGLDNTFHSIANAATLDVHGSVRMHLINGYTLIIRGSKDEVWKLERGGFIKQVDGYNCGPIACLKILEQFSLTTRYKVKIAYDTNSICTMVTNEWIRMAWKCNNNLRVNVRQVICPLLEPTPDMLDGINMPMNSRPMTRATTTAAAIAAAVAATVNADNGDLDICFCARDGPTMELIHVPCCQHTNHKQCLVAYLGINTHCPYC
jgi:hypothetical protein